MRLAIAALAAALAAGCARDVHTRLPAPADQPTGTIVLHLTRPASDLVVAVNGILAVDGASTSHIRIDGVPTGYADVAIAMGPAQNQLRVWVSAGEQTVVPLGSPGGSPFDSLKNAALSLAAVALYAWIR